MLFRQPFEQLKDESGGVRPCMMPAGGGITPTFAYYEFLNSINVSESRSRVLSGLSKSNAEGVMCKTPETISRPRASSLSRRYSDGEGKNISRSCSGAMLSKR
jgi:hypothetical protein